MKKIVIIAGIIVFVILLAYFGISFYIAEKFTTSPAIQFTESPSVVSPTFKNISIKTPDNVAISGWYFMPEQKNNCTIIMVPGFTQNRIDPSYGAVDIAKELLSQNYSVVMYDPRGSGLSEKTRLGFGSTEGRDILGIIEYLKLQNVSLENIGIIGNSLGAITTAQFLPQLSQVGAIVLDSPATVVQPIVERGLRERNIPSFMYPGVFLMAKLFFNSDVPSVRPIDMIAKVPERRLLFLHGEKDSLIPVLNSKNLLAKSNPDSELITFPNAEHVQTFKTNPEVYKDKVLAFFSQQLPQCQ